MNTRTHTHTHIHTCTHTHTYAYTHIRMHTHSHTHTLSLSLSCYLVTTIKACRAKEEGKMGRHVLNDGHVSCGGSGHCKFAHPSLMR